MEELLTKVGLSDKEAKVYLSVLQLGRGTIQEIAKQSRVKRVTTYVIIDQLKAMGLVDFVMEGKKQYFSAEHPSKLYNLIDNQINEISLRKTVLTQNLDQLEAVYNYKRDKPVVRYFEGHDGLIEMDKFGHEVRPAGSTSYYIFSRDALERVFSNYRKQSRQSRIDLQIKSKTIVSLPEQKEIVEIHNQSALDDSILLPQKSLPIGGSLVIYPDWGVKFFNMTDENNLFGVLIQDARFADDMKAVFDLAWDGARYRMEHKMEEGA